MNTFNPADTLKQAQRFFKKRAAFTAENAIVLGSGFASVSERVKVKYRFSYAQIPGMEQTSVKGHASELLLGQLNGKNVAVFCGRNHFYEGYSITQSAFVARLAKVLGAKNLILTCAAGSVKKSLAPETLAIVCDHINWLGNNPLRGAHDKILGERFVDLSQVYDKKLRKIAQNQARLLKIKSAPAIYCAFTGPSYETPAEIKMASRLGADIVGMSTVPEAIAAAQSGLRVLALALISNWAAGISKQKIDHIDVLKKGQQNAKKLSLLIEKIVDKI